MRGTKGWHAHQPVAHCVYAIIAGKKPTASLLTEMPLKNLTNDKSSGEMANEIELTEIA